MDIARAKELVSALADGVDPFTGEVFPRDHICNHPDIIRALHQMLDLIPESKKKTSIPNAGKVWSQEEQDRLVDEFHSGMKLSEMAKEHGRSRGSIETKLARLGLIEDSYFIRKPR